MKLTFEDFVVGTCAGLFVLAVMSAFMVFNKHTVEGHPTAVICSNDAAVCKLS